jgi:hypothetical protein
MAASSRENTPVSFDFDDFLQPQPQNPLDVSSKETQSTPESLNSNLKPPHDDVLDRTLRKVEQDPEQIQSFECGHNVDLMRDKVSVLGKIDTNETQVAAQSIDPNNKSGDDDGHEVDEFIEFKDCVARKFKFPYKGIKKWKVMFSNTLIPDRLTFVLAYESYYRRSFQRCRFR